MIRMPSRRVWGSLATTVGLGLVLLVAARLFYVPPNLKEVGRLAKLGRFDLATRMVNEFLLDSPDHAHARLLAAEIALDRPSPLPRVALDHLSRIRTPDPDLRAMVKLDEGKAAFLLGLYGRAEECWLAALRLSPSIPEAPWALLDMYYVEGRRDDARSLALQQHGVEPDPRDRVQFLLELVRQDAEPPEPSSVVARLTPIFRKSFRETRATLALGLALIHNSQTGVGLAMLRLTIERRPDDVDAWDAYLTGLDDAGRSGQISNDLARLPASLAEEPRMLRHQARAAESRGDRSAAISLYQRAWQAKPDDFVAAYRLGMLLHAANDLDQAAAVDLWTRTARAARDELPSLYKEADDVKDFGKTLYLALYRRLADNREKLGRREEARAWHRLILDVFPNDRTSLTAIDRLK
jgi:tetratricopeptide (TPR) repeat protein